MENTGNHSKFQIEQSQMQEQEQPLVENKPAITAVISTRNREDQIIEAVKSILANQYPDFRLIVVDQSDNDLTKTALEPLIDNPKLFYLRSTKKGLANGLNTAIVQASELVAITDDDCIVPPNWLEEIVNAFQQDEKIGVVLGNLWPGEHDPSLGWIPTFICKEEYYLSSVKDDIRYSRGWGACMGFRRSAWQVVNGFDSKIGPGAPLKSGNDRDFSFRVLSKNYFIYFTPRVGVTHNGFRRKGQESRLLSYRYGFGSGAQMAKHLKIGNFEVVVAEGQVWLDRALKPFLKNIFFERKITGVTEVYSFGIGFFKGLVIPVDRATGNYKS